MAVTAALPSALTYEVSVSTQLVDLDLQRTLLKQWLSPHWFRVVDNGLRRWFSLIASLWIATVGCCMTWLVYTDEPALSLMVVTTSSCVVVMLLLCCTLSVDVLWLLVQQHEFWFTTLFNTLHWSSLSLMYGDKRFVGCFFGWLHVQMALTIDANFSFHLQMARSSWMCFPDIVVTVVLALFNKLAGQRQLEIVVMGKTVGDLIDVLTLTSTTLIIFLLKILILKQRTASLTRSSSSSKVIPCVVAKTTLRLCPSTSVVGSIKLHSMYYCS
ncbi:hypothetical protein Poli38472_010395 [Pythium oligandrum]|uniref:Uncharacterized protein n=1 Tax=Pythium oligandrum TaxID=41045 RepID=A0A8K1FE49_PYTOL|nr:hypothetical protein Poli38472_010395 [Pythium oligandrum]|eukprot:TMW55513.1 hypothetical protein Poli38472_010395 [Pythium oligandrum]